MADDRQLDEDVTIEEAARRAVAALDRPLDQEDERAIQRLVLAYGMAADFVLLDEMAQLFTEDAVWDGTEFRFPVCNGPEEIRAHFATVCRPDLRQVHVMELPLLWQGESPDRANGLVPFNAMQSADGTGLVAAQHVYGIYVDRYRRTPAGWRIEHRTLRMRLVRK